MIHVSGSGLLLSLVLVVCSSAYLGVEAQPGQEGTSLHDLVDVDGDGVVTEADRRVLSWWLECGNDPQQLEVLVADAIQFPVDASAIFSVASNGGQAQASSSGAVQQGIDLIGDDYGDFDPEVPPPGTACQFVRGDADGNQSIDLADAILILDIMFSGATAPLPFDIADVNDSGTLDISDPMGLLDFIFSGGPSPLAPFPMAGFDFTPSALSEPACWYQAQDFAQQALESAVSAWLGVGSEELETLVPIGDQDGDGWTEFVGVSQPSALLFYLKFVPSTGAAEVVSTLTAQSVDSFGVRYDSSDNPSWFYSSEGYLHSFDDEASLISQLPSESFYLGWAGTTYTAIPFSWGWIVLPEAQAYAIVIMPGLQPVVVQLGTVPVRVTEGDAANDQLALVFDAAGAGQAIKNVPPGLQASSTPEPLGGLPITLSGSPQQGSCCPAFYHPGGSETFIFTKGKPKIFSFGAFNFRCHPPSLRTEVSIGWDPGPNGPSTTYPCAAPWYYRIGVAQLLASFQTAYVTQDNTRYSVKLNPEVPAQQYWDTSGEGETPYFNSATNKKMQATWGNARQFVLADEPGLKLSVPTDAAGNPDGNHSPRNVTFSVAFRNYVLKRLELDTGNYSCVYQWDTRTSVEFRQLANVAIEFQELHRIGNTVYSYHVLNPQAVASDPAHCECHSINVDTSHETAKEHVNDLPTLEG